jgi:hypothetical protein
MSCRRISCPAGPIASRFVHAYCIEESDPRAGSEYPALRMPRWGIIFTPGAAPVHDESSSMAKNA